MQIYRSFGSIKPLVKDGGACGNSIFVGLPTLWECRACVRAAGLQWPPTDEWRRRGCGRSWSQRRAAAAVHRCDRWEATAGSRVSGWQFWNWIWRGPRPYALCNHCCGWDWRESSGCSSFRCLASQSRQASFPSEVFRKGKLSDCRFLWSFQSWRRRSISRQC